VKDCVGLNRGVDKYFLGSVCTKFRSRIRFQPGVDQEGRTVEAPYVTAVGFEG
jgi:hypothetical protein